MIPLLFLLLLFPSPRPAQTRRLPSTSRIRKLYNEERYREIVAEIPASPADSPQLDLYRGLALARLKRWVEARAAFQAGLARQPKNARFLVELAGVDYRTNHFGRAIRELRRALALRPGDAYARDFLATIYLTEGNLEAALAEWNRIGKPQISAVRMNPRPHLRNALLEHAFTFAPLGTLRLRDLETTKALLDHLDIFPLYQFDLFPSATGAFAVDFRSAERQGWGSSVWDKLARLLRDLPTTIRPDYYNLHDSAINITSLFRWDQNKRRVAAAVSTPLRNDPRWRLTLGGDARNENWDLSRTFRDGALPVSFLNLERVEFGARLSAVESGRWSWQTGLIYAYRRFRDVPDVPAAARSFFTDGSTLEYRAGTTYRLVDIPERRLTVDSGLSGDFGRNFAPGPGPFGSLEASVHIRWFPRPEGRDYQTTLLFRTGRIWGRATLDQLYQLGVERDNNLPVRGISGTRNGRKGNAPLGREFVLWNWETDKTLFDNGFLTVQLGPSFDVGRIADPSGMFGSTGWLLDPGFEWKFRILGDVEVVVSYGYDVRSGSSVVYESASR